MINRSVQHMFYANVHCILRDTATREGFIRETEVHINTLWVLFHMEAAKTEIKQQPDGFEPFIYSQSSSFLAAFLKR